MSFPRVSFAGRRIGRLLVTEQHYMDINHKRKWLCVCDCGTQRWVASQHLRPGRTTSCGCLREDLKRERRGENHPNYKGGWTSRDGYRFISKDGEDILEHRAVMEKVLGRQLMPDERVHHRNGKRADNRPKNLELWTLSHPAGQRVSDAVAWAREILVRYEHSGDTWGDAKG